MDVSVSNMMLDGDAGKESDLGRQIEKMKERGMREGREGR